MKAPRDVIVIDVIKAVDSRDIDIGTGAAGQARRRPVPVKRSRSLENGGYSGAAGLASRPGRRYDERMAFADLKNDIVFT
jgi:hypothetical protein